MKSFKKMTALMARQRLSVSRGTLIKLLAVLLIAAGIMSYPADEGMTFEAPVYVGYEEAILNHSMNPLFRPSGSAPAIWGPGDLYSLLVTGEETQDAFFQFEAIVPSGGGPPPHRHSREDETFYVVRGSLEIQLDDSMVLAHPGDFVFIPRGTLHRFRNVGDETAVQVVTFVPAGMEKFFREVFPTVINRKDTPPRISEDLINKMHEVAPKYGLIIPNPGDTHDHSEHH